MIGNASGRRCATSLCRSFRIWSPVITVVVLVAGCGGDDDASSESSPSDVTTATDATSATTPASDATQATDPPATDPPATDPPGGDVSADPGAIPAEMCPDGAWPMVAAYDIETGGVRWAACEPGGGLFLMAAAAQDTVWVTVPGPQPQFVAFDAESGAELWRGDEHASPGRSLTTPTFRWFHRR